MTEIYCDESRPEVLYSNNSRDRFMLIGGIWIPDEARETVKNDLKAIKQKYNYKSEIKWIHVSPSMLDFFMEIVQYFFSNRNIHFRCIVVEGKKLDIEHFHNSDNELGFYKFYYQLLFHWINPLTTYKIFLDQKKNKRPDRLATLRKVLNNASFGQVDNIQAIDSKESLLIQLTDFLIGAVGYGYNGYSQSQAKLTIVNKISEYLPDGLNPTYRDYYKFNIFKIILKERK